MKLFKVLKGKIHDLTVTDANVEYEGSITIDGSLLEASGIFTNESVHVWNMTRGTRLETYVIPAPPGSGTVCLNGAAALQNRKGDKVIVAAFTLISEEEMGSHKPKLIFADADNGISRRKD